MVRRALRAGALACAVALMAPLVPAGGPSATSPLLPGAAPATAQTLDDLDRAEEEVEGLSDALDVATARYEDTWARIEARKVEIETLERQAGRLEREAAAAEGMVSERARQVYKYGTTATFEALLASDDPEAAVQRAAMLSALQRQERGRLEEAVALRQRLERTTQLLEARVAELDQLQEQLREDAEALQAELEMAQSRAARIRTLVARQRRIDRGAQQGIYACIFDPGTFRFRDTWGAPRSGGRRHKGTDVFAPMNQPVFAFTSGVVIRNSHSRLGGIGIYLRGDDGNVYYYAHLNSIEPKGRVGSRVVAGELIARNGSTGNADRWAPHVHFELHPGGGAAINPYPWLAASCF